MPRNDGPLTSYEYRRLMELFCRQAEALTEEDQEELDALAARSVANPPEELHKS